MPAAESDPAPLVDAREAMASMCRQIHDLRVIADSSGELSALERILAVVLEGGDVLTALADLQELLRRCGVPGGLGGDSADQTRRVGGLPNLGGGHPVLEGFVCPVGRCARVDLPDADPSRVPICGLHNQPLRLVRV